MVNLFITTGLFILALLFYFIRVYLLNKSKKWGNGGRIIESKRDGRWSNFFMFLTCCCPIAIIIINSEFIIRISMPLINLLSYLIEKLTNLL